MAALGNIDSTTLEGAFIEIAVKLQKLESQLTPPKDNVRIVIDADDKTATIRGSMPVTLNTGATGLQVAASPYV